MYQDFRILTVDTDIKNKSIVITSNFDISSETVTDANVQIYNKETRNNVEYKPILKGKVLTLELLDWPEPNIELVLSVQKLKTVLGDDLVAGVRRKIVFKSSICSKLEITYPSFGEVIDDLKVAWKEVLASSDHEYVNSFYIEISTENGFHNILKHFKTENRNDINLSELSNGQYYVRGRVQKDDEYGAWSEIITFIIGDVSANPGPIFDPEDSDTPSDDSNDDIYTPDINIISRPINGETPKSILIEFDSEIDPDTIAEIIVIRRSI